MGCASRREPRRGDSLNGTENLVLGLPLTSVLAQRLRLPTVEAAEFNEMVRIQIEKALPYSTEEVTTDFEIIEQTEEGSVVSAIAVHNAKLSELAARCSRAVTSRVRSRSMPRSALRPTRPPVAPFSFIGKGRRWSARSPRTASLDIRVPWRGRTQVNCNAIFPNSRSVPSCRGIDTSFPVVLLDENLFDLRANDPGFVTRAD